MAGDLLDAVLTAIQFHLARFWKEYALGIAAFAVLVFGIYSFVFAAPVGFPAGQTITIKKGTALPEIITQLAAEHVIKNALVFEGIVRVFGRSGVRAGPYRFNAPISVFNVAARLLSGNSGIPAVRLTFTEGETAADMSKQIARALPITSGEFVDAGQPYEGYLFPDTYNFAPDTSATQIVSTLRGNFDTKISTIQSKIASSSRSLSDIVIMASIVEKEARTPEDKRIVAGILWARVDKNLPLQVDAVFGYIEGRPEFAPSLKELMTNSPYNTYQHKGLPPGPISNPGLDSLEAAAAPTKTSYLFYLTGHDGLMHYAATFAGHLANEQKYLN